MKNIQSELAKIQKAWENDTSAYSKWTVTYSNWATPEELEYPKQFPESYVAKIYPKGIVELVRFYPDNQIQDIHSLYGQNFNSFETNDNPPSDKHDLLFRYYSGTKTVTFIDIEAFSTGTVGFGSFKFYAILSDIDMPKEVKLWFVEIIETAEKMGLWKLK